MPRRRPISSQSTTTKATAIKDEAPDPVILPANEEGITVVVAEQASIEAVMPEPKQKASKTIATDIGPVETKEQPRPVIRDEGAPSGMILEPDEPIRLEGDDAGIAVIVRRDVYRKYYPRGTKRPSYMLLYKSGARVLKSTLMQIPN